MLNNFFALILFSILSLDTFVSAEVAKGDLGISLNYPGIGTRYFFSDKISGEIKAQIEKDIFVGGVRGYYYLSPKSQFLLFFGLEGDFTSFKGKESKGNGFAGEVFAGGEYFFARQFSFQFDFGPALISLKDDDTSVSVSGLEYVVNFGINYYFGKGGK
jgi:hypothetical protein